jgi:hypothetical protein
MSTRTHGSSEGNGFQIKSVVDTIKLKEAVGKDTSFERSLLKAWSKRPGYSSAKAALEGCDSPVDTSKQSKPKGR